MALLEATVVVVVDVVVVVSLLARYWSHYIKLWSINVNLRLLRATTDLFLWWVGGWLVGVCTVIFVSSPTTVLRLYCGYVVLSLGL